MVNIYSYVEDLECTEHYDKAEDLKEELRDAFDNYCEENEVEFTWLSDSHIAIDDEESAEDIESEIVDILSEVYDNFIEELDDEEDEEE